MRILITGVCGFVGSALARHLMATLQGVSVYGLDSLMRPGSETNRNSLRRLGVTFIHGDIRCASDVEALPAVDWVIDAAANPSVLAGIDGSGTSRQLLEHNLGSLFHVLEYCKRNRAGFILLSTNRVFSIAALAGLPLKDTGAAFELDSCAPLPTGASARGIGPAFSTEAPVSLYGSTKLACEVIAFKYGLTFDLPDSIHRCGGITGAGHVGAPDQGIFDWS